jgi:hypothetical protein
LTLVTLWPPVGAQRRVRVLQRARICRDTFTRGASRRDLSHDVGEVMETLVSDARYTGTVRPIAVSVRDARLIESYCLFTSCTLCGCTVSERYGTIDFAHQYHRGH